MLGLLSNLITPQNMNIASNVLSALSPQQRAAQQRAMAQRAAQQRALAQKAMMLKKQNDAKLSMSRNVYLSDEKKDDNKLLYIAGAVVGGVLFMSMRKKRK
jgi:hypothetical protein